MRKLYPKEAVQLAETHTWVSDEAGTDPGPLIPGPCASHSGVPKLDGDMLEMSDLTAR